jgi:hypothetical protein
MLNFKKKFSKIPLLDSPALFFGRQVAKIRYEKKPCISVLRETKWSTVLEIVRKSFLETILLDFKDFFTMVTFQSVIVEISQ